MAAKPTFSKEQLNFFKFSTLVLDEFPKVLRQIFTTMWDRKVAIRLGFIVWDDSSRVRNMLLTSEGGKTDIPITKSIKEWDCTALFKATIYAKTFGVPRSKGSTLNDLYLKKSKPAPGSFHSSVQSATGNQDETYALAIDQLRLLRNTLCHSPKPEIVKPDFDHYVKLVNDALTAVNVDTSFVDVIGQMSEDDFPTVKVQELRECRVKELQAVSMFHENVEQKLSSLKESTEEIRTMVKNISWEEKGNMPDKLPKPHIPSAVPFFTGREMEIEEITNLVTGQSTRLLNIWGSPGFGKTSTAIAVAHRLVSLGYRVYFFKLQGITSVGEYFSQILSIFKSKVTDLSLLPIDRLVSIFREISRPIYLVFDNLDDFLSHTTDAVTKLLRVFDKFLDSSCNINILFTTRELLQIMRDQVKGFQDVRIRPLSPVSSVKFVRQLIPSFSEDVVAKVVVICSHVPLAMKLVASLVQDNLEEIANEVLDQLKNSENLVEQLDSPYEKNMQKLFETPFEQLTSTDKHALISITAFSSARVSKSAAIEIVSGEMEVTSKAVRSLKTLVKKSLIDEDPNGECYSIHPLIYSFVVDKAKHKDFENVLYSSRVHFSRYYLCLFEKFNDDFLAGKTVNSPQLQDTMLHLSIAMFQSITSGFESFHDVFRILAMSEIFFFLICVPFSASQDIHKLYDLAIDKCRTQSNDVAYLKLFVSKYFRDIAFSMFDLSPHSDLLPEDIRKDVMLLSDGSAAKLGCYEGISLITKGNIKSGIELIEKHLEGLRTCSDQQLIKCLCLQLLALYYTDLKEYSKSSNFSRKAIEVCKETGNHNLFLIDGCDQTLSVMQREDKGEPLILFIYLLSIWAGHMQTLSEETKRNFLGVVYDLQQQKENEAFGSLYLNIVLSYSDFLLALLGCSSRQERFLDEKIDFLQDSFHKYKDPRSTNAENRAYLSERLLRCYFLKTIVHDGTNKQDQDIDTCRSALELSLQQHGKQHGNTACCYLQMGIAETNADNYISALTAFDQALEIMEVIHDGSSSSNDIVAKLYIRKAVAYTHINKRECVIACYEEALKLKRKLVNEETEEVGSILFMIGLSHACSKDLGSAHATTKQALQIMIKCYAAKRCSYLMLVLCYTFVAAVKHQLGDVTEAIKCLKSAVELRTDCEEDRLLAQVFICDVHLKSNLQVDENIELLERSLPMIKKRNYWHVPMNAMIYLNIGVKQLESGKYDAGVASLRKALDIELDVTLRADVNIRETTLPSYFDMVDTLVSIDKSKLARKTLDRAFKVAESLPEVRQHPWMFRCYYWKGRIHNEVREYVSAIKSLEHALQLPRVTSENLDKMKEFQCRTEIVAAHFYQGAYKVALTSLYQALSIIKNIFPEGSEDEAETYLVVSMIAQNMKNRSLALSNLRLAYKMYSKVLGENHSKTEESYVKYARALINSSA